MRALVYNLGFDLPVVPVLVSGIHSLSLTPTNHQRDLCCVFMREGTLNIRLQVWDGLASFGNSSIFSIDYPYDGTPSFFAIS